MGAILARVAWVGGNSVPLAPCSRTAVAVGLSHSAPARFSPVDGAFENVVRAVARRARGLEMDLIPARTAHLVGVPQSSGPTGVFLARVALADVNSG
jgi:hypothetical protein